jgi:hypothetical protein
MKKKQSKERNEIILFLQITGVIIVVIILFAGLNYIIREIKKEKKQVEFVTNEILIGEVLKQTDSKYHVLIISDDNKSIKTYETYLERDGMISGYEYYKVDINSFLNKNNIGQKSNLKVNKIEDLKIKETTLLVIEEAKIVKAYEGDDAIYKYVKGLEERR